MRDRSLKIILICLFVLGFFLGVYEEVWRQGAKKVIKTESVNSNIIYLEVIWDASGSMWGKEYGVEKIIRSKEILKSFAEEIPEKVNLGLRIFGARKVGDLKDSFLALPLQGDREDMLNFISNVKPLGKSPIGYSLREAKNDLLNLEGKKYILLISDGIDNGDLPHNEVITELKESNIILHIVHIGDLTDEDLKDKLKEMAEKTGGHYFTYHDHKKVITTLQQ